MKVLISDSDELSREMLKRMLENWGHEVVEQEDGVGVWRALNSGNYPLAIIETELEEISGYEICERIRRDLRESYVYIILLTDKDSQLDINRGLQAGADDYIKKPFDVLELHSRVQAGVRIQDLELRLSEKIKELNNVNNMLVAAYRDIRNIKDQLKNEVDICNRNVFLINSDYMIEALNRSAVDQLGLKRQEIIGSLFLEHLDSELHTEFRKQVEMARLQNTVMEEVSLKGVESVYFTVNILRIDHEKGPWFLLVLTK